MSSAAIAAKPALEAASANGRSARAPERRNGRAPVRGAIAPRRPMVTPFARALSLLSAFTPQDRWLGNRDLAARTGLPASTVTRIAQSLVLLGYLRYEQTERKYRLAPSVLALGYGAIANSNVQQWARVHMKTFADQHKVHVNLSTRDRLDLIVLESCSSTQSPLALNLHVGSRVGIAGSPMGWALLAALPDIERYYLLENVERRMPREWPRVRRRLSQGVAQVHDKGFCTSIGEWDHELAIVAAPLLIEGHAPLVLACVGASAQMTRPRVERELGPRLVAMASTLNQAGAAE
jgi:DNA-binding IclR family transcriptional regulator